MKTQNIALMATVLATVAGSAAAATVPLYDDFSSKKGIDNTKWIQTAEERVIDSKQLLLGRRLLGGTAADAGVTAETFSLSLVDSAPPKAMSADITPLSDGSDVPGCAANPTPSFSRARLMAAYFNALKSPVPNDRTGDVLAQVRVGRMSDSVDVPNVLAVEGNIVQCTNADCSGTALLASANFGTTTTGTKLNARVDWLKSSKTFRFTVDSLPPQDLAYAVSQSSPPMGPFVQVAIRNEAANCLSGPRVRTGFEARFDNVRVSH